MIQRGSMPHAISGDVQNVPLGMMSQVASAVIQALSAFHVATVGILTDVDNTWKDGILGGIYQGETLTIPEGVSPNLFNFNARYPINIPGDLTQRATILRMISPSARIGAATGLDLFFPEIQDPAQELAQARTDDAQMHPVFSMLNLISALRDEAEMLRKGGNGEDAALLDSAQQVIKAQLQGMGQPQQANGREAGGIPSKGLSPEVQQMLQQLTGGVSES